MLQTSSCGISRCSPTAVWARLSPHLRDLVSQKSVRSCPLYGKPHTPPCYTSLSQSPPRNLSTIHPTSLLRFNPTKKIQPSLFLPPLSLSIVLLVCTVQVHFISSLLSPLLFLIIISSFYYSGHSFSFLSRLCRVL
ncbi:hypothetical protein BJ508DRAFT_171767 [Ascobolus immersus RN42]|uniref:Uncharacterized protein n=1 Tax=Ascobolus immersus RN42 TaxID=1160509 RepID=A0A3N4HZE6_ASCIM|nr:hypothetical protein BJ508DRAFT_171767 [Ascobolus immersus RN42]